MPCQFVARLALTGALTLPHPIKMRKLSENTTFPHSLSSGLPKILPTLAEKYSFLMCIKYAWKYTLVCFRKHGRALFQFAMATDNLSVAATF